jgi:DNA polymerase
MSHAAAESLQQWWTDAGVDTLVGEIPRDWLRAAEKPVQASGPSPSGAPAAPAAEAELPGQLNLFQAWLQSSETLSFAAPAAPRVCPSGDPAAGLMILTDMPAAEDCASGNLLSGRAGRLFDRMLAAIGRDRASIYLAAMSCLRAPSGRLTGEPAQRCATLARHHLGLAAPRAVLILGDDAARALLGLGVTEGRGRWHEVQTHSGPIRALVSLSPDHLLLHPRHKAAAWADLQMLAEGLNG